MSRCLMLLLILACVFANGPAAADPESVRHYGPHPATIADVILVLEPQETFLLDVPIPGERTIHGTVLRIERGHVPQQIVNTPKTIVAPLRAGVPVKLYLKSFKDRNVHYIIGVFPASEGGRP